MVKTHRITQGDQATFKVPLLVDGVETSITGWSLVMTIDADPEAADDAAFTASAGNGRVEAFSETAWIVRVPSAASELLAAGLYYFAYRATSPSGEPSTLERGQLIIEPKLS